MTLARKRREMENRVQERERLMSNSLLEVRFCDESRLSDNGRKDKDELCAVSMNDELCAVSMNNRDVKLYSRKEAFGLHWSIQASKQ